MNTSKQVPNSPILRINHELKSIVVNKGRIHKELRHFKVLFEISLNWTMNCGEKLGISIFLER